jgi:nucleoside diphosphate kinase
VLVKAHNQGHEGRPYYTGNLEQMIGKPVVIMVFAYHGERTAAAIWKNLLGPTNSKKANADQLRRLTRDEPEIRDNFGHGSDDDNEVMIHFLMKRK